MSFILVNNHQQDVNVQALAPQLVTPKPSILDGRPHLTDNQFNAILKMLREQFDPNAVIRDWRTLAYDPANADFSDFQTQIRTSIDQQIQDNQFYDLDARLEVIGALRIQITNDKDYTDVIAGNGPHNRGDYNKMIAQIGANQRFINQVVTNLNAKQQARTVEQLVIAKLKKLADDELDNLKIDKTSKQAQANIYDLLAADKFDFTQWGYVDFKGLLTNEASIWLKTYDDAHNVVGDFTGLILSNKDFDTWVTDQINKLSLPILKQQIRKTQIEMAHDEATTTLTTKNLISFSDLNTYLQYNRLSSAQKLAKLEDATNGLLLNTAKLSAILAKYHIDPSSISITFSEGTSQVNHPIDANHRHLHVLVEYNAAIDDGNKQITIWETDIEARLIKPSIEIARENLGTFVSGITFPGTTVFEKVLIDSGLFTNTPDEIRKLNAASFDWKQISRDTFRILTNHDLTKDTQPNLDIDNKQYDYRIFVHKVDGRLEFKFILVGGDIPKGEDQPGNANEHNQIALSQTMAFKSYLEVIREFMNSYTMTSKSIWYEQFIVNPHVNPPVAVDHTSDDFIREYTNYYQSLTPGVLSVLAKLKDTLSAVGANIDDAARWGLSAPSWYHHDSQDPLVYFFKYQVEDKVLSDTATYDAILSPTRAIHDRAFPPDSHNPFGLMFSSFFGDYSVVSDTFGGRAVVDEFKRLLPKDDDERFIDPPAGSRIPLDALEYTDHDGNIKGFDDLIQLLAKQGITYIPGTITFSDSIIPQPGTEVGTFTYWASQGSRMGGTFNFRVDFVNSLTGAKDSLKVSIFVPLENRIATPEEIQEAVGDVKNAKDEAFQGIDFAVQAGEKIDADGLRAQILGIISAFDRQLPPNVDKISQSRLALIKNNAIDEIRKLIKDIVEEISTSDVLMKLAQILGVPQITDMKIIRTVEKYIDVIDRIVDLHPPISKEDMLFLLTNTKLLEQLHNVTSYLSKDAFNKTIDYMRKVSTNYKYGYFGVGAALGVASLGGVAAMATTMKAASRTKKIEGFNIRIRSHKLISVITGGISLLMMGGSVAMLVLFFVKQGGF